MSAHSSMRAWICWRVRVAWRRSASASRRCVLRSLEQIGQCFAGLEMLDPGLVPITQWRPEAAEVGKAMPIDAYGAVARKL